MQTRQETTVLICAVTLLLGLIAVYGGVLHYPYLFDDKPNILRNPSIHSLSPAWKPLFPAKISTFSARPVANYSFAISFAISGGAPWGHRAMNILVHFLSGLVLFGLVRRVLGSEMFGKALEERALLVAWCAAAVWLLHPVNTMAVTYISQRAESLMALFYLLTLYCAFRGWQSRHRDIWHLAAVLSCLLGAGTKEVIVAAPFVVLLFDRLFVSRSVGQALRSSPLLYGGLLLPLAFLAVLTATGRQAAAGSLAKTLDPWDYLVTQAEVLVHYFRLAVWPDPLVFDYAWGRAPLSRAWPRMIAVLALLALTFHGVVRRKGWAFLLFCVFLTLAPTSSIIPIPLYISEYRIYLPLAFLAVLAVSGIFLAAARLRLSVLPPCALCLGVAVLLGGVAHERNQDYSTELRLWEDTVAKRPDNAFALQSYGNALIFEGRPADALQHLLRSEELRPGHYLTLTSLGLALYLLDQAPEALRRLDLALEAYPEYYPAIRYKVITLLHLGRVREAADMFAKLEEMPLSRYDDVVPALRKDIEAQLNESAGEK